MKYKIGDIVKAKNDASVKIIKFEVTNLSYFPMGKVYDIKILETTSDSTFFLVGESYHFPIDTIVEDTRYELFDYGFNKDLEEILSE